MKEPKAVLIPTKDVADSMLVLIATGAFERFGGSDDVLVDKQSGDYVYLMTCEAYQRWAQKTQEREPRQRLVGVVAVPCVQEARRALLEYSQFDPSPGSDSAVTYKTNGAEITLVPFSSKD